MNHVGTDSDILFCLESILVGNRTDIFRNSRNLTVSLNTAFKNPFSLPGVTPDDSANLSNKSRRTLALKCQESSAKDSYRTDDYEENDYDGSDEGSTKFNKTDTKLDEDIEAAIWDYHKRNGNASNVSVHSVHSAKSESIKMT